MARTNPPSRVAERTRKAMSLAVAAALGLLTACAGEPDPRAVARPAVLPTTELDWENDVALETLADSVHAELECADCHVKSGGSAARTFAGELQCRGCHREAEAVYDRSVHGASRAEAQGRAARCQDCHGAHDVYPTADPRSRVSKRRTAATCSKCHDNPEYAPQISQAEPERVRHYAESIHGDRLVTKGTVVAPSCVDCHGDHEIAEKRELSSKVHRTNVSETCGSCHRGITRSYSESVHGKALAARDPEAPDCTSCHSAHSIEAPAASFKLASDRQCGACHRARLEQHLGTYHGRAHALGGERVAACFDCHGSHDVLSSTDPASRLAPARRVETCRACHEGAPPKLAAYLAHGDASDRVGYPLLFWTERVIRTAMLAAVALCLVHAALWLVRRLLALLSPAERPAPSVRRSRRVDRFCVMLFGASVVLLVATGMPLKLHQAPWAHQFFAALGGADVARALHRLGAVVLWSAVLVHLTSVIARVWRARAQWLDTRGRFDLRMALDHAFRPDSVLLGRADLGELVRHVRWFVGRGPEPERRRFRYWEKLDLLALFTGVAVVGSTGLVLWLPELFARVLPGWWINLAHTIHSEEALLVVVFLLLVFVLHLPARLARRPRRAASAPAARVEPSSELSAGARTS